MTPSSKFNYDEFEGPPKNLTSSQTGIYAAMSAVMADVAPIAKNRKAQVGQGSYQFRGIDDLYNALQPIFAKHKVFCTPHVTDQKREERQTKSGGTMIYTILTVRYSFHTTDGSSVNATVVGEAMDTSDKSTNKAMSAAQKYAFLQIFNIPTDEEKDTETAHIEPAPKEWSDLISEAQRKRLFAIATTAGFKEDAIKMIIEKYGYESTKDIRKSDYDKICAAFE